MVHVSGVSREKSSDSGQGSDDVGLDDRMRGAFCERARAVGGGICEGGESRLACDMAAIGVVKVGVRRWSARWNVELSCAGRPVLAPLGQTR